jgi:hypothetical protein
MYDYKNIASLIEKEKIYLIKDIMRKRHLGL